MTTALHTVLILAAAPADNRWYAAIWPWAILAIAGLVGSMIFSGMETGLYTLSRLRLQLRSWRRDPAALQVERWLRAPAAVLAGLLIWQNICNFAVSAAATVILRDVDALSPEQQQQVLGWLQQDRGAVQVVATSARPVWPLVESGHFDASLYYALNVVCLVL